LTLFNDIVYVNYFNADIYGLYAQPVIYIAII